MNITDAFGNKQIDVNTLNTKILDDKLELFDYSCFRSAFKLNDKSYAIYDARPAIYPDANPDLIKLENLDKYKNLPLRQFYLVPINNNEEVRELAIDESFERYMFIRSNPILDGKVFFYLRKPEIQDASGNVTRKNAYFIALFDGKNVETREIKPDNRLIDWWYNDFCAMFFE
jgi:hypothetical protein